MTRVLLLGPVHDGGSLPPYLEVLTRALREQGAVVTRHGSTEIPYDHDAGRFHPPARLRALAAALADRIDPAAHDVIALHAGNLEVDQLVPALLGDCFPLPIVHHGHTLAPTLLRDHSPNPVLLAAVHAARERAAGHVWFGTYARNRVGSLKDPTGTAGSTTARETAPVSQVAWLPTTIPPRTHPAAGAALAAALDTDRPIVSLYGYAAPWKDAALLLEGLAAVRTPLRAVLAGDFWDDPSQAGTDLAAYLARPRPIGDTAELVVVPGYLDAGARLALVAATSAAVFPYRPHGSFQGSGAIADYLAHGVPVVATDVANMAELIGPAGAVTAAGNARQLASALDDVLRDVDEAAGVRAAARRRAPWFTAAAHATRCLQTYRTAAWRHAGR